MTAERALVIILSAALALALVLTIIILVNVIIVVRRLQKISDNIEQLSDKAISVSEVVKSAITPLAVGKIIASIAKAMSSKDQKRKKRKD